MSKADFEQHMAGDAHMMGKIPVAREGDPGVIGRAVVDGGGMRFDAGKRPVGLIAPEALIAITAPRIDNAGRAMYALARFWRGESDGRAHLIAALSHAFNALVELTGSVGAALYAMLEVLEFGAFKYAPRNWERGMPWFKVYEPAVRHWTAHESGELVNHEEWRKTSGDPEDEDDYRDETRTLEAFHIAHFTINVMFLHAYHCRGIGTDDRDDNGGRSEVLAEFDSVIAVAREPKAKAAL